ncbi:hypothetical protein [Variovorax sp. UMC13]|uniref:hypothetical protein n=1 Tax=Variovorax sp. UMC13 TaxID=1862326 RepID=UPI001603A379|nr:hypothetical protein [Variovorax sp. UMC13]MBB1600443.1 hypothetical protein [Variovorax sp. UMC13]
MQVYGDVARQQAGAQVIARMSHDMRHAGTMAPGLSRHSLLVTLLIDAGMLAQGAADARLSAAGEDTVAGQQEAMALTTALARCCWASWCSGYQNCGPLPFELLARCEATLADALLLLRVPEGYAFYAVYPELYGEAARRCRHMAPHWQVFGLRSIGTSLAAMVAVALGAPVPRTLRPVGHPFDREIAAPPLQCVDGGAGFAVVDEGPGLSGSSMAAAGRWLQQAGVATNRLHFFPSHAGLPGPEAGTFARTLWTSVSRQHVSFEDGVGTALRTEHQLRRWVETLVGPLVAPLQDIGNGRWRPLQTRDKGEPPPPAHPWQERLKYLAFSGEATWLVKFVGLGRMGERALVRANALGSAGFTPAPAGLRHGFLVERWRDDLGPLPSRLPRAQRASLLTKIGDYLAFRSRSFPAAADSGASMASLLEMTRCNATEAFGVSAGERCAALERSFQHASADVVRVETDNRMHRWEWLAGRSLLLKTDAVDHAAAHDLVGCQDIAWDMVGAEVEWGLSPAELRTVAARAGQQGAHINMSLIALLRPSYLAFQWAHFAMAVNAADAPERAALVAERDRYRRALRIALEARPGR